MADAKISDLTELGAAPAADDEFVLVDKSDTSEAASGTDKKMRYDRISGLWMPASGAARKSVIFQAPAGVGTTAATTGSKWWCSGATQATAITVTTSTARTVFQFTAADFAITGLTTKLALEGIIQTGGAVNSITITPALYPVTSGATSTLGTVVSGSDAGATAVSTINTVYTFTSGDFTVPSDGLYGVGFITSGTPGGVFTIQCAVYVHHV